LPATTTASDVVARIYDPQRADIYMKLGIPTVATSLWTTQQVKRWMIPNDESIEWTNGAGSLHLVETRRTRRPRGTSDSTNST